MKSLIIGSGEVGKSLYEVLERVYKKDINIRDVETPERQLEGVKVLNICYPYSGSFVANTEAYIEQYKPNFTIIHSTVPVGTTRKLGKLCVHSPIHGKHPNLVGGIRTFVKYVGSEKNSIGYMARCYLEKAGITTKGVSSPEASEMSKILCTTYYGWNIVFAKEVKAICDEYGLDFKEVYTGWNNFYNQGYSELGMSQFVRPVLEPIEGAIGGHCIVNNSKLLDSFVTNLIRERDKEY